MADALTNVKKKLADEIALLEHELAFDLPKEIMVARAPSPARPRLPQARSLRRYGGSASIPAVGHRTAA